MHLDNNLLGLFFAQNVLNAGANGPVADTYARPIKSMQIAGPQAEPPT
jgi:hypothetical protein